MTFNTDKIEPHGYFPSYLQIASQIGPHGTVLELGVENGESLRMWQALFPLGTVVGVDHSEHAIWPPGTKKIISAQDNPALPDAVRVITREIDLIVDDASHHGIATRNSFDLLWPMVRPGGFYVVEDWQVALCGDNRSGRGAEAWGPSMLKTAEWFLRLLDSRDAEVDTIVYRYGMVIIHKSDKATDYYLTAIQAGIMSIDEARGKLNLPPWDIPETRNGK